MVIKFKKINNGVIYRLKRTNQALLRLYILFFLSIKKNNSTTIYYNDNFTKKKSKFRARDFWNFLTFDIYLNNV